MFTPKYSQNLERRIKGEPPPTLPVGARDLMTAWMRKTSQWVRQLCRSFHFKLTLLTFIIIASDKRTVSTWLRRMLRNLKQRKQKNQRPLQIGLKRNNGQNIELVRNRFI